MSYYATMRYKSHSVTVKLIGNQVIIDAPIYLAKVWAQKKLKEVAKEYEIELTEIQGIFFISHSKKAMFEEKIIPELEKCKK